MKDRIKWMRLQGIAEELVGRRVEINLSTMLPEQVISVVDYGKREAIISLNAQFCKEAEDVIRAVAHEVAHVRTETSEDTQELLGEWDRLTIVITKEYLEKGGRKNG